MNPTADRPSAQELDQLAVFLKATPLDRPALAAALRRIELGLHEHRSELDQSGGLLDEADKAHRMSLSREDDRLCAEVTTLIGGLQAVLAAADVEADEEDIRRCGSALLAGLRGHRDAEASLLLESADTEVGSGD